MTVKTSKIADAATAQIKTIAEEGFANAQKGFAQAQASAQENLNKGMKSAEELVTFSQGNLEAVVKAAQIWATGLQELSRQMLSTVQASAEEGMANVKALASVKSVKEAGDLQANFAKAALDKTVAGTQKISTDFYRLAEEAAAPITARVQMAVEKANTFRA